MKSHNKKLLNKYESKIGLTKKRPGVVIIYNPDFPDFETKFINAGSIIALPDNGMDRNLTEKIGDKFVVL